MPQPAWRQIGLLLQIGWWFTCCLLSRSTGVGMFQFDRETLEDKLHALSVEARCTIAFCAALRLWPSIREGDPSRIQGLWGNLIILRELVRGLVIGSDASRVSIGQVSSLAFKMLEQLPRSDTGTSGQDSYVDDACACFLYACFSLLDPCDRSALFALSCAHDAAERYALRHSHADWLDERQALRHPVLQMELRQQLADILDVSADDSAENRRWLVERAEASRTIPMERDLYQRAS